MRYTVSCPGCDQIYNFDEKSAGKTLTCGKCGTEVHLIATQHNMSFDLSPASSTHSLPPTDYETSEIKKGCGCIAGVVVALVILISLLVAKGGCGSENGGGCSSDKPDEFYYKYVFEKRMKERYGSGVNCTWKYAFTRKDGNEFEGACTVNGRTYAISGSFSNGNIQVRWNEMPSGY